MSQHTAPLGTSVPSRMLSRRPDRRRAARAGRWMLTFVGFPAAGLATELIVGPLDTVPAAAAGGLLTGLILGLVQAWGLGLRTRDVLGWVLATGVALAVALPVATTITGYGVQRSDLVVQGLVCGLALGAAQSGFLWLRRLGGRRLRVAWPLVVAAAWAVAWLVTSSVGVRVDERFSVFGSSGAIVATLMTLVLPLRLDFRRSGR